MKPQSPVLVIGAGIGGMACAIALAARGIPVEIVERSDRAGGKMRNGAGCRPDGFHHALGL